MSIKGATLLIPSKIQAMLKDYAEDLEQAWANAGEDPLTISFGAKIGIAKGKNNPAFGRILPTETLEQIRRKNKQYAATHQKIFSLETRTKISLALSGSKHPNWKGGTSRQSYPRKWFRNGLRDYIKKRDVEKFCWNPTCSHIGTKQHRHHIDYNKENCSPSNIITLCNVCNIKANSNRVEWAAIFQQVMLSRGLI